MPRFGESGEFGLWVFANMLNKVKYVLIGKLPQGADDKLGVELVLRVQRGSDDVGSLAFYAYRGLVGKSRLGATTVTLSIVMTVSFVDGSACCANRRAAVTLIITCQPPTISTWFCLRMRICICPGRASHLTREKLTLDLRLRQGIQAD